MLAWRHVEYVAKRWRMAGYLNPLEVKCISRLLNLQAQSMESFNYPALLWAIDKYPRGPLLCENLERLSQDGKKIQNH